MQLRPRKRQRSISVASTVCQQDTYGENKEDYKRAKLLGQQLQDSKDAEKHSNYEQVDCRKDVNQVSDIKQDWSEEQCQQLRDGVTKFFICNKEEEGGDVWTKVAAMVPGKSVQECLDKYFGDLSSGSQQPQLSRKYKNLIANQNIKFPASKNKYYVKRKLKEQFIQKQFLQDFGLDGSNSTPGRSTTSQRAKKLVRTLGCQKQIQKIQSFSRSQAGTQRKKSVKQSQKQKYKSNKFGSRSCEKLMLELNKSKDDNCSGEEGQEDGMDNSDSE